MSHITHRAALSAAFLLTATVTAQSIPEVEPNDIAATAQPISAGQHVLATLVAGEQDWFTFTLTAAAEVHLQTSGNFNVSPSVDTAVLLYDATGTTRLAWNDNQRGNHSDCGVNLPAGTYTCLVVGKTGTIAGAYGLDFLVLPAAAIQTVEGSEPNGDPAMGGTPTPITLGDTVAGELTTTSDVDWYAFTLTDRAIVQAMVLDDGGVPQLDNTRIALFQETAPGVYAAFGTASFSSSSHRALTLAHPATLGAGNYAIEISSATTTATGTAPLDYAKVGKYAFRTRVIDLTASNVVMEGAEPNNTPTTFAGVLNAGDFGVGNISGMNEGDWWAIVTNGPATIGAISDNFGATPIDNTTVRVLSPSGAVLNSATSGGAFSHGKIVFTVPSAGLYFVEVAGGAFAATGDYVIYANQTAPLFFSSRFQTTPPSTNACPGSTGSRPALVAASGETPQIGSTFVLRLQNALPNANAVVFFGFPEPNPIDLGLIGAPGCFLRVQPAFSTPVTADALGVSFTDLSIGVTALPGLVGFAFTLQAVLLDPTNNALGISMSNDVTVQLGDRGF